MPKTLDIGTPLAVSGAQNGAQWFPKGCAAQLASALFGGPSTDLLPRSLSELSWSPF